MINDSRDFPYFELKTSFTSSKSISLLVTISLIKSLSLVPIPAMLLYKHSAKNSVRFLAHFTEKLKQSRVDTFYRNITIGFCILQLPMPRRPSSKSPENSFLMAFSNVWPVILSYSVKMARSWAKLREHKMALNVDSSVPNLSSPVKVLNV